MKRKNIITGTIMVVFVLGLMVSCNKTARNNNPNEERNEIATDNSVNSEDYQAAVEKAESELEDLRQALDKIDENDPDFAAKLDKELNEFNENMDEISKDLKEGSNNLGKETDEAVNNARMKARELENNLDKWADKTGDNLEQLGNDIKQNFRELKEDLKKDS